MKLADVRAIVEVGPPSRNKARLLALLDVAESADQLVKVTSHGNLRGVAYVERRECYDVLRDAIERMEERP
jgi:hypothetical protein